MCGRMCSCSPSLRLSEVKGLGFVPLHAPREELAVHLQVFVNSRPALLLVSGTLNVPSVSRSFNNVCCCCVVSPFSQKGMVPGLTLCAGEL